MKKNEIIKALKDNRRISNDNEIILFHKAYDALCMLPLDSFDSDLFYQISTVFDDKSNQNGNLSQLAQTVEQIYFCQRNTPLILWNNLKTSFKLYENAKELFGNLILGILNKDDVKEQIQFELKDKTDFGIFLRTILLDIKEDIGDEEFEDLKIQLA